MHRQRADLGPQRGKRLLPVGLDLRVPGRDVALLLGVAFGPHLSDDRGALFPGLLAQPGGLVPGIGQQCLVLIAQAVRVGLSLSGLVNPPSIASVRSSRVLLILGSSTFQSAPKTMKNAMVPMIASVQFGGNSGFCTAESAICAMCGYLPGRNVT